MGLSTSCAIFEKFSAAIQWLLKTKYSVKTMSHILDDFIFLGPSNSHACINYLNSFLDVAAMVNIPIKHEKTVLPTTCTVIHGIEVDTVSMQARLPQDKIDKSISLLAAMAKKQKVKLRDLQSLIGTLNFAGKVIIPGRAFLRRLMDLTIGVSNPTHHVRLGSEARKDIQAWLQFMQNFNGKSLLLSDCFVSSNHLNFIQRCLGHWVRSCVRLSLVPGPLAGFLATIPHCHKRVTSHCFGYQIMGSLTKKSPLIVSL